MTELSTREEWTSVLDSVDTVLFDCDGKDYSSIEAAVLHNK